MTLTMAVTMTTTRIMMIKLVLTQFVVLRAVLAGLMVKTVVPLLLSLW